MIIASVLQIVLMPLHCFDCHGQGINYYYESISAALLQTNVAILYFNSLTHRACKHELLENPDSTAPRQCFHLVMPNVASECQPEMTLSTVLHHASYYSLAEPRPVPKHRQTRPGNAKCFHGPASPRFPPSCLEPFRCKFPAKSRQEF
jgi:hypothetical protein